MVMSEMAFRRSRAEPWQDSYLYSLKSRGGEPAVGHTIPFQSVEQLLAAGALENSIEGTLSWRWFCQRTADCRNVRCKCKASGGDKYEPEEVDEDDGVVLRVLYRLYPQTAMQGREFTRGTDSYRRIQRGYVCNACDFSGSALDIEQHYREDHSELRETRVPEYRVVVAITQLP
jgi:hypothetical protein